MASSDTKRVLAAEVRHVYGPRPVGALVPGISRAAFRRHSAASAKVMADWVAIVGPALGAVTLPRRLSAGTLTIACAGPLALELQHVSNELMARINAHLGGAPVQRLRFVQASVTPPVPAGLLAIPQEARIAAERAVKDLPDGDLRDSLVALGSRIIAHSS